MNPLKNLDDPKMDSNNMEDNILKLSVQQNYLYEVLLKKNADLAKMYYGTLYVLDQHENPDRFALAAHGIRELMEKIPEFLRVENKAHNESLGGKVRELENEWEKMLNNTHCNKGDEWDGTIDKAMSNFLKKMNTFIHWINTNRPKRREEVKATLRKINDSPFDLPQPLEDLNATYWSSIRDFFISISHHRRQTNEEEFTQWLESLEDFLLSRWIPRTFEDISHIDKIIMEGKNGNHS